MTLPTGTVSLKAWSHVALNRLAASAAVASVARTARHVRNRHRRGAVAHDELDGRLARRLLQPVGVGPDDRARGDRLVVLGRGRDEEALLREQRAGPRWPGCSTTFGSATAGGPFETTTVISSPSWTKSPGAGSWEITTVGRVVGGALHDLHEHARGRRAGRGVGLGRARRGSGPRPTPALPPPNPPAPASTAIPMMSASTIAPPAIHGTIRLAPGTTGRGRRLLAPGSKSNTSSGTASSVTVASDGASPPLGHCDPDPRRFGILEPVAEAGQVERLRRGELAGDVAQRGDHRGRVGIAVLGARACRRARAPAPSRPSSGGTTRPFAVRAASVAIGVSPRFGTVPVTASTSTIASE